MRRRATLACGLLTVAAGCVTDRAGPAPTAASDRTAWFTDLTTVSALAFQHVHGGTGRRYLPETMGAGGCALDYDGDGRIDLYLVQSGHLPGTSIDAPSLGNRLFRNRGDGTFAETSGSGTGDGGYGMGAVCVDYDGDGDSDIYVVNFGANTLLRNDGDGTFSDVTAMAGVGDPHWGSSAAWLDGDNDGQLDLYVVNYLDFTVARHVECGDVAGGKPAYCHPDAYPMAPDVYYRSRGDGTFEDATSAAGLDDRSGKGLGVVAADLNGDGVTDIYVANDSTPNFLYLGAGDGTFREEGLLFGVSHNEDGQTEAGMGVDVGDVDGDGRADIFVTNLSLETNALYLGSGDRFSFATRTSGLYGPSQPYTGFGTDLFDVDNDGDLDVFVANGHVIDNIAAFNDALTWRQPGQLLINEGARAFTELPAALSGALARPVVGRGSITLDYDDDGRLDLLVTANDGPARLLRNVHPGSGHWIGFVLRGNAPNRAAVGTRVTVEVDGRSLTEERKSGSSYQTSGDPRLHFGLGDASAAARVTVHWPDGATDRHDGLSGGAYYRLAPGRVPLAVEPTP